MWIVVTGGRDFADYALLESVLDKLPEITGIAQGGARGADFMARRYGRDRGIPDRTFHAHWDEHGKKAGILRNIEMIDTVQPRLVVSFPGGRGTQHCMSYALKKGIRVIQVSPTGTLTVLGQQV